MRAEKNGTPKVKVSYVRWSSDSLPRGILAVPLTQGSTLFHFPTVFRTSLDVDPMPRCPLFPPSTAGDCGSPGITPETCRDAGCCFYSSNNKEHSGCYFNSEVSSQAINDFQLVLKNRDYLLSTHMTAWRQLWSSHIEIRGNLLS